MKKKLTRFEEFVQSIQESEFGDGFRNDSSEFGIGDSVKITYHDYLGVGKVIGVTDNGEIEVEFDDGDTHFYIPGRLEKVDAGYEQDDSAAAEAEYMGDTGRFGEER